MKRYKMKTPRAAVAIAAVAMAALTLGGAVVLPAPAASCGAEPPATASMVVAPAEVAISPEHIEIVSARETLASTNVPARVDMAVSRR